MKKYLRTLILGIFCILGGVENSVAKSAPRSVVRTQYVTTTAATDAHPVLPVLALGTLVVALVLQCNTRNRVR